MSVVAAPPEDSGAVVPAPTVAPPAAAGSDPADLMALQSALDEVARGFRDADPEAIRPWLYDERSSFARRWLRRADNMAEVPLADYRLSLDDSLPDLATERLRARYPDPIVMAYVVEEHSLEGFDAAGPASEDLFLTAVRTEDGWRFASDSDAEPLGLISVDHLWDQGPVLATVSGPVMALHHPDTPSIGAVLSEARRALDDAREAWPLAWPDRVPILVPADEEELAELLHVTFDLSSFVAFATATPTGELGGYELTGTRVVLNTPTFLSRESSTRRRILVHELVHAATRPVSGRFVPSWLDEGVAQVFGERRSTTGTVLLDAIVAAGFDGGLPTDGQFTVGGRDRIFLSYQLAWSFLDYLVRRFGEEQVATFYAAAGQGAGASPGTEAWHVDAAAREVFGASLAELQRAWGVSLG